MVKDKKIVPANRRDAVISLGLMLVILVLLNVVGRFYYYRWDLTSEKRYSISKPTRTLIKNLKDEVTIKVYLDGDLNAGFSRLKESTKNLLNEFRAYGGKNISFEFVDPMAITNLDERKAVIQDLVKRGLRPENVTTKGKAESKQQLIFPGAIVTYGGHELPVQILENQIGFGPEQMLNNSEILLEYKFASAIQKLTQYKSPAIAFLKGNGELSELETSDIKQTLQGLQYEVLNFDISKTYYIPDRINVIVIAKPTVPFDEKDKYKIDQYIMRGGKVLWLIEGTNATMDSLRGPTGQFAMATDLNLGDQLFKYGARVNNDVVQDINLCNQIPLMMGNGQPQLFPWYYFPLLISDNNHSVVKNLDPVASYFASTIDTIKNPEIRKTILLHTTENARAQMAPTRIHFGILQNKPTPAYYNQPKLPIAVLLQGQFQSSYKGRRSPEFIAATDTIPNLKFIEKSPESKMIVIGDGDIIRNQINADSSAYPLGYDRYTKQQFANKNFVLNCIEYLIDDSGILETRNKEITLRLLNSIKAEDERIKWQIINVVVPIFLVILFGVSFMYYRKRKYAR